MNKILSQEQILKNPASLPYNLTDSEFIVLQRILFSIARYGNNIDFNQLYLSEEQGFTHQTVNRAIAKLKKLGLVLIKRRRRGCGILSITKYFSLPRVRAILSRFFRVYPVFKITICMLLSEYVHFYRNKTSPDSGTSLAIRYLTGLTRCPSTKVAKKREKGYILSQMSPAKLEKIADIEAALVKRGLKYGEFDISKLFAFSDECLDDAISTMKHAKPKQPFGFFLSRCFEYCKWNNIEPDYQQADVCRSMNILEKYKKSQPARQTIREQIAKEPAKSSSSQQLLERQATEKRLEALEKANLEDYLRRKKAQEQAPKAKPRFENGQLVEEIAGMKWHVENLTERAAKGEPGANIALMMAKGTLARREHELQALLGTVEISTETKSTPVSHSHTVTPTQIVQHMSNLFLDGFTEGEDDQDIPD